MFRYIAFSAVACSQTLYLLFKVSRTGKFLHFYSTSLTEILQVSVRGLPSYYMRYSFLCSRFYFTAHKGVVHIAVSTLITACDLDASLKGGASGEDRSGQADASA